MLRNLGDIASGKKTIAFALTKPDAGSDASAIKTLAVRHGDEFVISGRKMFITNGAIADLVTMIALTDPEKRARGGITGFIVEKGTPGFTVGRHEKKMRLRGSTTTELISEESHLMDNTDEGIVLRASPIRQTLGIRYLGVEPGRVSAEFSPGSEFTNANGTVQGGILCSFLDHIMGQSAYTLVGPEDRLITLRLILMVRYL